MSGIICQVIGEREPTLDARLTWLGDCAWLTLEGELDIATVAPAYAALEAARDAVELTIDLRRLRFIDAAGLRLLLDARRAGRALRCIRGPRCVQRVISIAKLQEYFEFVDGEVLAC
jgi:anti-anti-sigma factor